MTPETITVQAGIVSINGRPLLRFASTAQAGTWLILHGWRVQLRETDSYTFVK